MADAFDTIRDGGITVDRNKCSCAGYRFGPISVNVKNPFVNRHISRIGLFLLLIVWILCGCDTGRVGMYRVSFDPTSLVGSQGADEELKQLVRDALEEQGLEEKPGVPHVWRKRGTAVRVYRDNDGRLILSVGAFGSRRDVRVSERTEEDVVRFLERESGLSLTPITPPKATIK